MLREARMTGQIESRWQGILHKERDHARASMQWNASKHAGSLASEPEIMVNTNDTSLNVEAAEGE